MIQRYQTKDMSRIWSEQNKYDTWLKVELAVVEALTEEGMVPKSSFNKIRNKAKFSVKRTHAQR
mgnify:CR=1 FL=1